MGGKSAGKVSTRYSWLALAILFFVALFNYIDRSILSIMQVAIKKDLGLSDTELGMLTGLAFALFYSSLALPLARLTDRVSRKYVLTAALTVWTSMTALSSLAGNFAVLLVCRMGVAVGEAGCVPATHSLLSDYFPRSRRALAMGIWSVSLPLGAMLGVALGGQLTAMVGWRRTFLLIGLSGLLLIPLMLTLKEPERGRFDGRDVDGATSQRLPIRAALRHLWSLRAFRYLAIGEAIQAYVQNSQISWNGPFYSRSHHLPLAVIGGTLSLIIGFGGAFGAFAGGATATRLARRDLRWLMRVPAIAAFLTAPFTVLQYLSPTSTLSFVYAIVPAVMVNVYLAPGTAVAQSIVPASMRAFTASVFLLGASIGGSALGPTITGVLSDLFTAKLGFGVEGLRYALLTTALPAVVASLFFFRSATHLPGEMAPLQIREGTLAPEQAEVGGAL
jgi:MFS family permease